MASFVLAAIASSANLGVVASFGLAVVGAYLDALIVQALGGEDQEGQRTDDFRSTRSEYGIPIPLCYGGLIRVPGNIIWTSGVREIGHTKKVGGNIFGGSSRVTTFSYFSDVAVAISARRIRKIRKIWANNRIFFRSEDDNGEVPSIVLTEAFKYYAKKADQFFNIFADDAAREAFFTDLETNPPPTSIAVSGEYTEYLDSFIPNELRAGIAGISSEWSNVVDIYDSGQMPSTFIFPEELPPGTDYELSERDSRQRLTTKDINRINFLTTYPFLRISSSHVTAASNVRIYFGGTSQRPNSLMEVHEGVGNVPAYRGIAYVVMRNVNLTEGFRNSVPNFEFEIESDASLSIGGLLEDLSDRAGLGTVSTSGLTEDVDGMAVFKNQPLSSLLPTLEARYQFNSTQQSGQIRFLPKPSGMSGTLSLENMGGRVTSDEPGKNGPITYTMVPRFESPRRIMVRYLDRGREYQTSVQYAFRSTNEGDNDYQIDLAMAMDASTAREVAEKIGKDMWSRKWGVEFATSSRFIDIKAGDTIGIPFNDEVKPMLVTSAVDGRNGLIEVKGEFEDFRVGFTTVDGQSADFESVSMITDQSTVLAVLDAPLIFTEDDNKGVYWAASGTAAGWAGADILYSDGGDDFFEVGETNTDAAIGFVATALPAGPSVVWDRTNVLTVEIYSPSAPLQSETEEQVLAGKNLAWVGSIDGTRGELIQFVDATLVSGTTYQLSTLLRGRYGTEHEIGIHGDEELFVLMDTSSVASASFDGVDWDQIYLYSAVSAYAEFDLGPTVEMANTGIRSKPLSPVLVQGERDGSNNLTITWVRRLRGTVNGLGGGPEPLNEETESYEIDVTGPGGVVIRTITSSEPSATYSGTDQFNDGLTPGDPVDVSIYQISATKGRGYPARATV